MDEFDCYRRKLSKKDVNAFPLRRYSGPTHVVDSEQSLPEIRSVLAGEAILGFDTETRPAFRKGVSYRPSLLQIAAAEDVYIFKLAELGLPQFLREILASGSIVKAGVAIADDIDQLRELSPFEEAGFVDLGDVSRELGLSTNGLRNMSANLLGFRISKGAQTTNWARRKLSQRQIVYAATDAWVGRELYLRMRELGMIDSNTTGKEQ